MKWQNNTVFPLLIINAGTGFTGLFVYDPAPGAGTLIDSISDPGASGFGTDPYGNVYIQGMFNYKDLGGGLIEAIGFQNGTLQFYSAASEAGPWTQQWQIAAGAIPQQMQLSTSNSGGDIQLEPTAPGATVFVLGTASGLLTVQQLLAGPGSPTVQFKGVNAGDRMLGIEVTGDTNFRYRIDTTGQFNWGSGAAGTDCTQYRQSAGLLGISNIALDNAGTPFTRQSMNARGYQNNWADNGGTFENGFFEFQAQNNKLHLAGVLQRTGTPAATETVVNLPAAYHPASDHNFPIAISNAAAAANMFFQYLQNGNLVARNMNPLLNPTGIGFNVMIDLAA